MIEIVIIGLAVLVAFVCLMSLDLPTSASVDDRDSDHRPRSDGFSHVFCASHLEKAASSVTLM